MESAGTKLFDATAFEKKLLILISTCLNIASTVAFVNKCKISFNKFPCGKSENLSNLQLHSEIAKGYKKK